MAGSRYDARKKLVLDEVNAVETTYLRAGLLPEPYRTEFQDLLRKYIDIRAQIDTDKMETVRQVIVKSEELHNRLWSKTVALTENSNYFCDMDSEDYDKHVQHILQFHSTL